MNPRKLRWLEKSVKVSTWIVLPIILVGVGGAILLTGVWALIRERGD